MTMHHIASSTSTTTFSFTNIPQTFSHLHIRYFNTTSSNNGGWFMRMNSDSGANYNRHIIYADGTPGNAGTFASVGATEYAGAYWGGATSTNGPQISMTDLFDYSSTSKLKTFKTFYGNDLNGSGIIVMGSGAWRSTSAITSIDFIPAVTLGANSRVDLYGISSNPNATGV
jgi:hypothetical protein